MEYSSELSPKLQYLQVPAVNRVSESSICEVEVEVKVKVEVEVEKESSSTPPPPSSRGGTAASFVQ